MFNGCKTCDCKIKSDEELELKVIYFMEKYIREDNEKKEKELEDLLKILDELENKDNLL